MRQTVCARATTTGSSIGSCDWPGECDRNEDTYMSLSQQSYCLRLVRQIEWSIEVWKRFDELCRCCGFMVIIKLQFQSRLLDKSLKLNLGTFSKTEASVGFCAQRINTWYGISVLSKCPDMQLEISKRQYGLLVTPTQIPPWFRLHIYSTTCDLSRVGICRAISDGISLCSTLLLATQLHRRRSDRTDVEAWRTPRERRTNRKYIASDVFFS